MPITRRHFFPLAAAAVVGLGTRRAHAQQTLPLAGIAYASIRVKQMAASKAFYQSLGYEEQMVSTSGDISTLKINDHQYLKLCTLAGSGPGFVGLGFESADLSAQHDQLASNGLKPTAMAKTADGDQSFSIAGPVQVRGGSAPPQPQTVEFMAYAPDSRLGAGFGQHLGTDRVADRMLAVSVPCVDVDDAREFYLNDLSFKPLPGSPTLLHLPGISGQYVAIVSGGEVGSDSAARARLVLETATLGRAERHLHREHIAFSRASVNKDGGLEVFSFFDPDGNLILVQQR